MTSIIFDVTPEELEASASKIESKTSEFKKAYASIYTAVSDLRVTYKGQASDTFNRRIESYKNEDYKLAKQLSELDDSIDRMFDQVLERMLDLSANNPQKIQHVMHIAYTARYIERFGDHLTNIAESILYLVKGETLDLNE